MTVFSNGIAFAPLALSTKPGVSGVGRGVEGWRRRTIRRRTYRRRRQRTRGYREVGTIEGECEIGLAVEMIGTIELAVDGVAVEVDGNIVVTGAIEGDDDCLEGSTVGMEEGDLLGLQWDMNTVDKGGLLEEGHIEGVDKGLVVIE
eukprot:CAMPEP_0201112154 /NCGR_PEP_ID=MMETSP0812-20130820/77072_1 /ASSEMBLY_ACC=CAM_ASM_000668 /TAXON_ID=98059 /ORGANISM="Dinobryon sp., Strain UTEXLB2267" /LENGTH=145 /DNA_ID=CAMNT_0047375421 /DNA_START=153 /DNA_END=591 /DNA_ORIENTATION=+